MPATSDYAVVYDLSDNRERRRVDRVMKGWGVRVQKSVFECRLTRGQRKRMAVELQALQIRTGAVRIYRVTVSAPLSIGVAPKPDLLRLPAFVF